MHRSRSFIAVGAFIALAGAGAAAAGSGTSPPAPIASVDRTTAVVSAAERVSVTAPDQAGLEAWAPTTVQELFTGSDAVVVARVSEVGPGEPLKGARHTEPEYQVPTERALVVVDSVVATGPGIAPPPATFDLYSTLPEEADAAAGAGAGTGLEAGRSYVLFLRESNQTAGRYWLAASGTFLTIDGGRLHSRGRAGTEIASLHGAPVGDGVSRLKGARATIRDGAFGTASPNAHIANRAEIRAVFEQARAEEGKG